MATYVHTFRKDPHAKLDYAIDWSTWLLSGETISTSTWTVGTGLTTESTGKADTSTLIWLSGGTAGNEYTVANKIVTSDGREDERSFVVQVEER